MYRDQIQSEFHLKWCCGKHVSSRKPFIPEQKKSIFTLIFLFVIYYAIFNLVQLNWIYITCHTRKTFNKAGLIWEDLPAEERLSKGGEEGGWICQREGWKLERKSNLSILCSYSSKMCPTVGIYNLWGSNLALKKKKGVELLRLLIKRSQINKEREESRMQGWMNSALFIICTELINTTVTIINV